MTRRLFFIASAGTLLAVVVSAISAAKAPEGRLPVYQVSGKATAKGQPVEVAEVVLYGATRELTGRGTPAPAGTTNAAGVFHLRSYDVDDGAPAGRFNVTIFWPEPI